MPFVYFAAAGLGVLVATAIAAIFKTGDTRRRLFEQLLLTAESRRRQYEHPQEPAARTAVRS